MRISVLASGSGGNAALFQTRTSRVLVDAGIPPSTLVRRMAAAGVTDAPTAVVITHAHGDHHRYVAEIALQWDIPVYVSEATRRMISLGGVRTVRTYGARQPFTVGDVTVHPLPLPHDAAQVSLKLSAYGRSAAIATDLGEVPPALPDHLAGCDVVLLESNHDLDMLWKGPYSAGLKRRIASSRGHLSNVQTHGLLRCLRPETRTVILMHLSETNNRPDLALESAADALADHSARLLCAGQDTVTTVEAEGGPQLELFSAG